MIASCMCFMHVMHSLPMSNLAQTCLHTSLAASLLLLMIQVAPTPLPKAKAKAKVVKTEVKTEVDDELNVADLLQKIESWPTDLCDPGSRELHNLCNMLCNI